MAETSLPTSGLLDSLAVSRPKSARPGMTSEWPSSVWLKAEQLFGVTSGDLHAVSVDRPTLDISLPPS